MSVEINTGKIQAELQELAGESKVKVKLNKSQDIALSCRETDNSYSFSFNPKKIRNQEKLDSLLNDCRNDVISLAADN